MYIYYIYIYIYSKCIIIILINFVIATIFSVQDLLDLKAPLEPSSIKNKTARNNVELDINNSINNINSNNINNDNNGNNNNIKNTNNKYNFKTK